MIKSKIYRSKIGVLGMSTESIGRVLLAMLLLFAIFAIACEIYNVDPDKKYHDSFNYFVDGINTMTISEHEFTLSFKEKAAIVGFSKNSEFYECINCYGGTQDKPKIVVEKPIVEACLNHACICLCNWEFKLEEKDLNGQKTKFGECSEQQFSCKSIERDIIDELPITKDGKEYWKNGFLFVNDIAGANGLIIYKEEEIKFKVNKRNEIIAVCNMDMYEFNQEEFGIDSCIITEYDEAKKLEEENPQQAIEKYKEFIEKYGKGTEVEESEFKIGEIYFNIGQHQNAIDHFSEFLRKYKNSKYKSDIIDIINSILTDDPNINIDVDIKEIIEA